MATVESNLAAVGKRPTTETAVACVADKGDHSREVLKALDAGPWTCRIAKPTRAGFCRWHGDAGARGRAFLVIVRTEDSLSIVMYALDQTSLGTLVIAVTAEPT